MTDLLALFAGLAGEPVADSAGALGVHRVVDNDLLLGCYRPAQLAR
jgi:hypothetical protein